MKVYYSSNNSGGRWWLSDDDWRNLEAAGWHVDWVKNDPDAMKDECGERWLGALATRASVEATSVQAAINAWEIVTGKRASDTGCSCCGEPHIFSGRE